MKRRNRWSLKQKILADSAKGLQMDQDQLLGRSRICLNLFRNTFITILYPLDYNPNLKEVSRATRTAYAKFMRSKMKDDDEDKRDESSPEKEIVLLPENLWKQEPTLPLPHEKKSGDQMAIKGLKESEESEESAISKEEKPQTENGGGKILPLAKRVPSIKLVPPAKPTQNTGKSTATGKVISGWI